MNRGRLWFGYMLFVGMQVHCCESWSYASFLLLWIMKWCKFLIIVNHEVMQVHYCCESWYDASLLLLWIMKLCKLLCWETMNPCKLPMQVVALLIHESMLVVMLWIMNLCKLPMQVDRLLIHGPMLVVMLWIVKLSKLLIMLRIMNLWLVVNSWTYESCYESMQVVNYVVNHNYMRSYHVIFPSCHAYAKNCTETIT